MRKIVLLAMILTGCTLASHYTIEKSGPTSVHVCEYKTGYNIPAMCADVPFTTPIGAFAVEKTNE